MTITIPTINTFTINEMHLVVILAGAYIVSVYVYLLFFLKLAGRCKSIDYVQSAGATAEYTHNLKTFHKRAYIFILLLSPAATFGLLFYAFAPVYLAFCVFLFQLKHEWPNIGMTKRQVYLPILAALLASFVIGRVAGWLFLRLTMI